MQHATSSTPIDPDALARALLGWYDRARRDLPWRVPPGGQADPYRVWLSEIMLQQTTVKAVLPYFAAFTRRWPDVAALARAERDEVLAAWAGLGYYSRAHNLYRAAQIVAGELGGRFPEKAAELARLPGIGAYTAAAVAAIAFSAQVLPVDGNVERVLARLHAIETPLPAAKPFLRKLAEPLAPKSRPGDFAQAMMDLGAMICTPRAPVCGDCPLNECCAAQACGLAEHLPYRAPRAERPVRRAVAFVALREDGAVLLRRRPAGGLLGGMMEVPSTPWETLEKPPSKRVALAAAPVAARWRVLPGAITHVFTHFRLELTIWLAQIEGAPQLRASARFGECRFVARAALEREALPSVMRKILRHVLAD